MQPQIPLSAACSAPENSSPSITLNQSGLSAIAGVNGAAVMPSFEESLKKLETIVDQLEKGDLALEESLKLFEEGVGLSAACKQELDAAEGKVQMLVKQRDGSLKPEPFLTEKPF
jgi:exodeoxyribonuclease VII small subunit